MKNKTIKKLVSVMLVASMAASMVVGCGSKDDAPADDAATDEPSDDTTADDTPSDEGDVPADGGDYTDYSGGFSETVTIKIPVYDRAFEGWDVTNNYYTQWVQKEFGDK